MTGVFAEALSAIETVEGWLSEDQARRLFERAAAVAPGGTIVELGSYHGRSTIVAAKALSPGASVIAIDPYGGNDRGPREWRGKQAQAELDLATFTANLRRADVTGVVRHLRADSQAALRELGGPVDLLYIDAAHRFRPCRADITGWGRRVVPGGTMLIHDAFSSVGVTAAILTTLALDPHFWFVGRSRSLAEYRRCTEPLRGRARALDALRQACQLPWFARNLAIKLALVLGLGRIAAALGGRPGEWPY